MTAGAGAASGEGRFMAALEWYFTTIDMPTRIAARSEVLRLYRAATGEVVGTATVIRYATDALTPGHRHHRIVNVRTSLRSGDEVDVDLVRRRDKEGV